MVMFYNFTGNEIVKGDRRGGNMGNCVSSLSVRVCVCACLRVRASGVCVRMRVLAWNIQGCSVWFRVRKFSEGEKNVILSIVIMWIRLQLSYKGFTNIFIAVYIVCLCIHGFFLEYKNNNSNVNECYQQD